MKKENVRKSELTREKRRLLWEGVNIDNAYVIVKIIGSSDDDIVNSIVKGTNRQNIVYDEAFEVTKEFHKKLETFFGVMQIGEFDKIYYERRSKQYENDPLVKPYQKISFRILIQSFVSLFLYKVEEGHHHESKLLQDYGNKIFVEHQSFYPYYVSSFIYIQTEYLFRRGVLQKKYTPYKLHIMLIIKELIMGISPDINKKKEIDNYCKSLLLQMEVKKNFIDMAKKACEKFEEITLKWVEHKGETYRYAMKDNSEFTKFMLKILSGNGKAHNVELKAVLRGRVLNVNTDRHGEFFGFIRREPSNIFFHEQQNPDISLEYENKEVTYDVVTEDSGRQIAINVKLLSE